MNSSHVVFQIRFPVEFRTASFAFMWSKLFNISMLLLFHMMPSDVIYFITKRVKRVRTDFTNEGILKTMLCQMNFQTVLSSKPLTTVFDLAFKG